MNIALLTGATSGIGKAICNMLLNDGFCVYGIGRDFSKIPDICARENFHSITCDLLDTKNGFLHSFYSQCWSRILWST